MLLIVANVLNKKLLNPPHKQSLPPREPIAVPKPNDTRKGFCGNVNECFENKSAYERKCFVKKSTKTCNFSTLQKYSPQTYTLPIVVLTNVHPNTSYKRHCDVCSLAVGISAKVQHIKSHCICDKKVKRLID